MNLEAIAKRIVAMICDGRMNLPLVEVVGYWIAEYTAASQGEDNLLALAHSIISNLKEHHESKRAGN